MEAETQTIIYIIDDEIVTVRRLVQALGRDGYAVEGFASAAEALARMTERPPHVVVMDVRLKDGDGVDLLPKVSSLAPEAVVILMTGYASIGQAVEAIRKGAFHYLAKPFRLEELREAVRDAAGRARAAGQDGSGEVEKDRFGEIIGSSRAMQSVFRTIRQVAPLDCNILLQGESGTGKELVARALHRNSPRASHPFIPFNCGAFTLDLVANELFGHEPGAFTGAVTTKIGLLEAADKGTVFLDEIGEMPPPMQVKLLRVIQERTVLRVGGVKPIPIDVRVIAASNRDLSKLVEAGEFRQDLYYRLKVVLIELPPLRERQEDIPLLVDHFVTMVSRQFGKPRPGVSVGFLDALRGYSFPGNVRELQNIVERAVALSQGDELLPKDLPPDIFLTESRPVPPGKTSGKDLKALEQEHIFEVYRRTGFNQSETARQLGISRTTLWRRLKECNFIPDNK